MENRSQKIIRVSLTGIAANFALAALKFVVGSMAHSTAILSDAVNNLTDSSSSLITIIGTRMAEKKPDAEHPFGHGRIEYLTSLIIGVIVVLSGFEVTKDSIGKIITPTQPSYSWIVLLLLVVSVAAKVALGMYTERSGRKLNSSALVGSGKDAMNDALVSSLTIVCALLYMFAGWNIDAWAGLIISVLIIKSGVDTLHSTIDQILGEKPEPELTHKLYQFIKSRPEILGAYDLILNDYGPGYWIGSVNVEVRSQDTVGQLYPILHGMQNEIYKKYKVYLVFGMYAIDRSDALYQKVKDVLNAFQKDHPDIINSHGIVIEENRKRVFFDLTIPHSMKKGPIAKEVTQAVENAIPGYTVSVTLDTEFV